MDDAQLLSWLRIAVKEYRCHVFPEAVRILRNYGGLTLGQTHIWPIGEADADSWFISEWMLNEVRFPIGWDEDRHFYYAVSSTGKVYAEGVADYYCGDSFEVFLEGLFAFKHDWAELAEIYRDWPDEKIVELEKFYADIYEELDNS